MVMSMKMAVLWDVAACSLVADDGAVSSLRYSLVSARQQVLHPIRQHAALIAESTAN
jgi:hypothetical protein